MSTQPLNNHQIVQHAIALCLQANLPFILWGPPGSGKSRFIEQLAGILGMDPEVLIGSIREPADMAGLPTIREIETEDGIQSVQTFAMPMWARNILTRKKDTVLFFDEMNQCPPLNQATIMRIALDREVADTKLPENTRMAGACNPVELSTAGIELGPSLANRFAHLSWLERDGRDADVIRHLALRFASGFPKQSFPRVGSGWKNSLTKHKATITGFWCAQPEMAQNEPENIRTAGKSWPSLRTWEMTATAMAAAESAKCSSDVTRALVYSLVGEGAGAAFMNYLRTADLADPLDYLNNPSSFILPNRGDLVHAVLNGIAATVIARKDTKDGARLWEAAIEIVSQCATQGQEDVGGLLLMNIWLDKPIKANRDNAVIGRYVDILGNAGLLGNYGRTP